MGNLAIIPARGGSKRIPKKNIKDFLGKPIIAYSIKAALDSNLFDEVIVSTDSNEIGDIAKKHGATVPFMRSDKNSDDFATLADVMEEVLQPYKDKYTYACCILPTAPLIKAQNIDLALKVLIENSFDSVRPISKFSYPIQRAIRISSDNRISFMNPEFFNHRSQDLEAAYHDAGQFYWMKVESGLKSENKGAIIIDEREVQDIDYNEDWLLAELKYKQMFG
ncbi:pseudaminic acid cytidylyltransferase [Flagellimonas flava]|uniref:pseudaminic acid cytidylyltransferase n=1 Tax=Flagellimonas flava TaxID=570519 RepID=UPI003D65ADE7